MTTVGHSRCEILDVIPAKVVEGVRLDERLACPKDDTIVSAPTPPASRIGKPAIERPELGDEGASRAWETSSGSGVQPMHAGSAASCPIPSSSRLP